MSVVPSGLDTESQPPMAIPLAHFVVALGFLVAGLAVGLGAASGLLGGWAALAHVHLLLLGWVCVTIMGAMTQFVPVWSGVSLHSRRLATAQLWLVAVGLAGMVSVLLADRPAWLPAAAVPLLAGLWTFVYGVGRTLAAGRPFDETETHFAVALASFALVALLGFGLAADLAAPFLADWGLARSRVVGAHATLAVFGAILSTVIGALAQLAPMFAQSDPGSIERRLRRVETASYPVGVVGLALGRLLGNAHLARVGGVLVAGGLAIVAALLARRLLTARVAWTPMLERYAVVAVALGLWTVPTVVAWARSPLAPATRFGAPASAHLLAVGVVGFVVWATLYHVVPFVIWERRYAERIGLERVPMIDDLYDDRLARADFLATLAGTVLLAGGNAAGTAIGWPLPREPVVLVGGGLVALGAVVFASNLLLTLHRHSPQSLRATVAPGFVAAVSRTQAEPPDEERANGGGPPDR